MSEDMIALRKVTREPIDVNSGSEAAQHLKDCKHICILTGAGLSAASGIPTFRGAANAIWAKAYNGIKDPTVILTKNFMEENPDVFWEWHFDMEDFVKDAKPNDGHLAIESFMSW